MKTKVIAKINEIEIFVSADNKLIPVRPLCELLGIDSEGQRQRILRDEIFGSTAFTIKAVAADGKEREMLCLPPKYLLGWLFTVDTSKINNNAKEAVIRYKKECLDVLYEHFFGKMAKREQSLRYTLELRNEMDAIVANPMRTLDDFDRYLEISKELKRQEAIRKALTKDTVNGMKDLFQS